MSFSVDCPICKTPVKWVAESQFRPFCSERCKLIDLGDWADEKHAIPVKPELDPDMFDDIGYDDAPFFKDEH
ncbi:DNA gyrase inhibitor YacG [Shewanella aestuarii]|uniref:DNA gyrase inhibitor YacG n=1 Tax=Shewanella aestuarii TaxID=1028752 RepID=A0A6G9QFN1_9GAMM|nr:DNA gyrase inhibitor YacG [Shewanella aestuarii]QIR13330.1 DNA gyrase inhibitor YacG [Shewanella aestuarii]